MPGLGLISILLVLVGQSATAQSSRPDFTGIWTSARNPNAAPGAGAGAGNLPFTEEGRRRRDEYQALVGAARDNPGAFCVTYGMPTVMLSLGAYPIEFIQRPEQLTMIYEIEGEIRRVFLGDNALPPERRFPNRQGYSIGRWEGNTLVVETDALSDGQDQRSFPHSDQAKITERFSMNVDADGNRTIDYEMTMVDPVYYTEPVSATAQWAPTPPGRQLLAYDCPEEAWLKLLDLRRAQLRAGEPITATMADVYATEMYE